MCQERWQSSWLCQETGQSALKLDKALFLEGADGVSTDFYLKLFAVNHQSFSLQIGLPGFFGVALREADVMSVLLAFFIKI